MRARLRGRRRAALREVDDEPMSKDRTDRRYAAPDPTSSVASEPDALRRALERMCFLEWRLEQMEATLAGERRQASHKEVALAEAASREASVAARVHELTERLAATIRENALLADRLAHADGTRATLESRLEQSTAQTSAESTELARALLAERQRAEVKARALSAAQERLEVLERAHDRFFQRLVYWQQAVRDGDPEAVDMAEFISELRAEIVRLSSENMLAAMREENLRRSLETAGIDPEAALASAGLEPPAPSLTGIEARGRDLLQAAPRAGGGEAAKAARWSPSTALPTPSDSPSVAPASRAPSESWFDAQGDLGAASGDTTLPGEVGLSMDALRGAALSHHDGRLALEALADPARRGSALRLYAELFVRDRGRREAAARALSALAGAAAAVPLAVALRLASDAPERALLVGLLGQTASPLARPSVRHALEDPAPEVRGAAVEAAVRLDAGAPAGGAALAALERGLLDPDPRVRRRSVLVAASAPGSAGRDRGLLEALRDPEPGVRKMAAAALSGSERPPVLRALAAAALDRDPAVARAALLALGAGLGRDLAALAGLSEAERHHALAPIRRRLTGAPAEDAPASAVVARTPSRAARRSQRSPWSR